MTNEALKHAASIVGLVNERDAALAKQRELQADLDRLQARIPAYEAKLEPLITNANRLFIQNGHYVRLRENVQTLQEAIVEAISDRPHYPVFVCFPDDRLRELFGEAEQRREAERSADILNGKQLDEDEANAAAVMQEFDADEQKRKARGR